MATYKYAKVPARGDGIGYQDGELKVPDHPIIPFIEGDGTGADIWRASVRVFDAAVEKCFGGKRKVAWMEVFAGEKAFTTYKDWLPQETVDALREFRVVHQGSAHDSDRWRHSFAQRDAAPGARPLRLHPSRALLRGRGQPDEGAGQARTSSSSERTPRTCTPASSGRPGPPKPTGSSRSSRTNWARRSGSTRPSASSRCRSSAPSAWCGWPSSTRSTTTCRR